LMSNLAKNDVKKFLYQNELKISINDSILSQIITEDLLFDLRLLKNEIAHHSHPENEILLEIFSPTEKITLIIGKDSDIDYEYWVFLKRKNSTRRIDIGRINSFTFNELK
jgi:hypothetical protein